MEPAFVSPALGGADAAFVVAVLALMLGAGAAIAGRPKTALDFLLAGRRVPAWAAGLSLAAAEASGVTLLAVPAAAYGRDWGFVQFLIGAAAGRVLVAWWLVPAVHASGQATIYQFLRPRLGRLSERSAAALFLAARIAGAGARLAVASAALSVALAWPPGTAAAVLALASAAYLGFGGAGAAVWAGALQALFLLAAAAGVLGWLLLNADGGPSALWLAASAGGRLRVFDAAPAPGAGFLRALFTDGNLLWTALVSGLLSSLAGFGADHELMQRPLCVASRREARNAVLIGLAGSLVLAALLLASGTALFAFYELHPGFSRPPGADQALPHMAVTLLPAGLRGLVLAALAVAAVDLPLASAGAVYLADLHPTAGESPEKDLRVARWASGGAAAFVLAAAALCGDAGLAAWAYQAGSLASGALLGLFALALAPRRVSDRAAAAGFWASAALVAVLHYAAQAYGFPVVSGWLTALGALWTVALARLAGLYRSG